MRLISSQIGYEAEAKRTLKWTYKGNLHCVNNFSPNTLQYDKKVFMLPKTNFFYKQEVHILPTDNNFPLRFKNFHFTPLVHK